MHYIRTAVVLTVGFLLSFTGPMRAADESSPRPNIIVIMADDLGYGDTSVYEGPVKTPQLVPAIAWWPGRIKAGSKTDQLTMGMDLLPTFMELAGIEIPTDRKLDGLSIRGLLLDGDELPRRRVFFGYEPKLGTAMRDGDWKMIVKGEKVELYDLSKDIGERINLVDIYPERAKTMKAAIEAWKEEVTWKPQGAQSMKQITVARGRAFSCGSARCLGSYPDDPRRLLRL